MDLDIQDLFLVEFLYLKLLLQLWKLEFGDAYVCGSGDSGQLGTGKRDPELKPTKLLMITDKVLQIACGIFHTLILTGINYTKGIIT